MDQNILVTERSRNLRTLGRDSLRGRWGLAVGGTVILALVVIIPAILLDLILGKGDASSGFSFLYNLLITGPITLGYSMFAMSIFRKKDTSAAEVFYGFERFGKALGLYLLILVFVLLWLFPVYIAVPLLAVFMGHNFALLFSPGTRFLTLLPLLVLLILCIPAYIAYFRYSMSYYILADNPDIGPLEAIRRSKRMMKGNKWKLLCMYLSFIGWYLLSICTLGIGMLWLVPYASVTTIAFYDIANGSLRAAGSAGAGDWTPDLPVIQHREEEPAEPEYGAGGAYGGTGNGEAGEEPKKEE